MVTDKQSRISECILACSSDLYSPQDVSSEKSGQSTTPSHTLTVFPLAFSSLAHPRIGLDRKQSGWHPVSLGPTSVGAYSLEATAELDHCACSEPRNGLYLSPTNPDGVKCVWRKRWYTAFTLSTARGLAMAARKYHLLSRQFYGIQFYLIKRRSELISAKGRCQRNRQHFQMD